jgi:hypothetical protein
VNIELNYEQRARVELIAIHTGRSAAQVLVDTAEFLLNCDADYFPPWQPGPTQRFLPEEELEARLARILRR